VQKFTRPLTREIELAGERLALTFSEQGIVLRPVGSRRPPWEMSWGALVWHITGMGASEPRQPSQEEVNSALQKVRGGGPAKPGGTQAPPTASAEPAPSAERHVAAPRQTVTTAPVLSTTDTAELSGLLWRLDRWLATERPGYHRALIPGANEESLAVLQNALGAPLPPELAALLSWHNGQSADFVGHFERDFDLMSIPQIIAAKRELDASGQGGWQRSWIPFLEDDNDNCVVVDAGQPQAPVREFWQGNPDHSEIARSLRAWLEDFVLALEQGEYTEDTERGTILRKSEEG
jgi:cell wall assembly regulator SMI1